MPPLPAHQSKKIRSSERRRRAGQRRGGTCSDSLTHSYTHSLLQPARLTDQGRHSYTSLYSSAFLDQTFTHTLIYSFTHSCDPSNSRPREQPLCLFSRISLFITQTHSPNTLTHSCNPSNLRTRWHLFHPFFPHQSRLLLSLLHLTH